MIAGLLGICGFACLIYGAGMIHPGAGVSLFGLVAVGLAGHMNQARELRQRFEILRQAQTKTQDSPDSKLN